MQDPVDDYQLDALAVCKTKIVHDDPPSMKLDTVPDGYSVLHQAHHSATRYTQGGSVCFIRRSDILTAKSHSLQKAVELYKSFECQLLNAEPEHCPE